MLAIIPQKRHILLLSLNIPMAHFQHLPRNGSSRSSSAVDLLSGSDSKHLKMNLVALSDRVGISGWALWQPTFESKQ